MSIYRRKGSPFWHVEIQVRGHRVNRSSKTASRREAEAFQRRLREELRQGAPNAAQRAHQVVIDYSIDQMFGRYWTEHGSKLRWAAEVAGYARRITYIVGHMMLSTFADPEVAHLVETMREKGTGRIALNRALSVLRAAHTMAQKRWGCAAKLIDWKQFRSKELHERVRWITREEAAALLAAVPAHVALIIEWSLYTGLRKAATLSLAWEHVNFAKGEAQVLIKGGRWRTVPLSDAARGVLERAPKRGRLVFDATNLRKHFEAGLKAAGIANFRFHDLRHTHATWLRREGAALEVVQRSLHHGSIQMTQRYAHVDDEEVRAAANAIGAIVPANVIQFKPRRRDFVYFISDGEHVKIGRSVDPERRRHHLQTSHPKTIWLVGTIPASLMTEQEAHARFAKSHVRGEWFKASPSVIAEIQRLCTKSQRDGTSESA